MADRLFVDLTADDRVSVSTWLEGELPGGAAGELGAVAWPLDADALEDLRWYLEDYLRAPFGVYQDRGPGVAARLAKWGQAVFGAVFGPGPARDAYYRVRARPAGVQVVIRSGSARWLGLPWELMRDPARELPLALDAGVAGIDRSLPAAELGAPFDVAGSGRLRVLMVISRPSGAADVGFRMIARPLLERLEAVRGNVDLVVLRPPTLDALTGTLAAAAEAGEPFQVVHFDGHGVLAGRRTAWLGAPGMYQDAAPEGVLVFQAADGGRDPVPASRLAQVLAAARVPVVVLNACQSGAVGKQLEAAMATRLLHAGAASVVAMAYSVYAVAAAEFMTAFYERLFAGDTVSAAVTAGRQRLFRHDLRPSPKGDLPLADWVVPVHYLRREVRFPSLITARPVAAPSLEQLLDHLAGPGPSVGGALAPVGVFTGRDGLFYELETATRLQKVVILQGPAGTGKTELAKAFGRWWQDTGGVERPAWVFWHSFEPGLASFGLEGVIAEIGLAVFGPEFVRLDAAQRTDVVEHFLRDRRALLIWDNFESVRSVPDPSAATPPLDEAGCQQLRDFLQKLAAGGRSAVLVTSRSDESWLDDGAASSPGGSATPVMLRRIRVAGLTPEEATAYAGDLLAPYPAAAPRRADRAFGELMQWLDGNPLSMRLVLPHLDTIHPGILLAGLYGTAPLPDWDEGQGGRLASLPASLGYSYAHLDPAHQRLLVAVCLFHDTADAGVLGTFSAMNGVPPRFQRASREAWGEVLDAAAAVGLLTRLGHDMYRLHPALPAYLAARWRTDEGAGYDDQRAAAIRALLSAYAAFGGWLLQQIESGDAGLAYAIIGLQQHTMGHMLGHAVDGQSWAEAQQIARPLARYWDGRGLYAESGAWIDRVRLAAEDAYGTPPELDSDQGQLWFFFVCEQARRQMDGGRLDAAERTYREILAMLQAKPTSPQHATIYHQLGMVAQDRGRLDEAADWYGRSLAIEEELGNRPGMASSYQGLGRVAQDRGRLDEAADWYARSLAIFEELGYRTELARSYHQLGMVAQDRGRLDEAADWYGRSLAIEEELGNRPGMASSYQGLGRVAQDRGRLDEAADWYARSLAIFEEELGNWPGMASSYQGLGRVAQDRGRLDEAADWYARSLAIFEELGNRPGMASSYGQLGLLAEARGSPVQALEWMVRCVALFDDFPSPYTGPGPSHIARLTLQLGIPALEACWQQVTGGLLPDAVREYVRFYPDITVRRWEGRFADLLDEDLVIEADLRALVEDIEAQLLAGVASATGHSVAAGRDVTITASGGGTAAGVIQGNVAPPGSTSRGPTAADTDARATDRPEKSDRIRALPEGSGSSGSDEHSVTTDDQPTQQRYLRGQCPDGVPVGKPFSLLVSIVLEAGANHARLEPFGVPPEGRDVLLVMHAPGLRLLSDQRQTVHVPAEGNSRPVMFDLCAETPGPRPVSVTAWLGGSYLGELLVEITAERDRLPGPNRNVHAMMATEPAVGAVSLVVRYDPVQKAYRFEFRDEDNPDEVTSNLAYNPGPLVEQLLADLDQLAKGRSGYSAAQVRDYLVNAGARLWNQLVPAQLREQFWDRQHRIRQLTILADKDAVPWELLYPMDAGHDAGFLVEQFPVTRAIFRWLPSRMLNLRPARFVLPEGSLPEARAEIDAMRRLLDPRQPPSEVISSLTPLQDLITAGNFGLLHFACHNTYSPVAGCSITLDNVRFTPMLMTTAAINRVLARSAPTIFINACRSAGLAATYNQLDGWASKFLEAGAAAFIGSLWAVSDGAAREFAQELYGQLQAGVPLGTAVMWARRAAATELDDPTWLAYTVYGNPRATITGRTP